MNADVRKKAWLLEAGAIHLLSPDLLALAERPSAGPDAGLRSLYLRFGRYRARMTVAQTPQETPFTLRKDGEGYTILRGDTPFLRKVAVETPFLHTPHQAFINLASPCIFDCKFCATPTLRARFTLQPDRVLALIRSAMTRERIEAIALTSGVVGSEQQTIQLLIDAIHRIRAEMGAQIPIGVEPYVTSTGAIDELYAAGANELKVNVESFDRAILRAVCPDLDAEKVFAAVEYAPQVFGRNRVCSNVVIGLGESDATVVEGLEWLAERGVVANLRPLLLNPRRQEALAAATRHQAARPSADRMLTLARRYKAILDNHGLQTARFQTMCHRCTGCEITPQQDV